MRRSTPQGGGRTHLRADVGTGPDRYDRTVRWRLVLIDVLVAAAAFTISAIVLADSDPLATGAREPGVAAYALLGAYSMSVVGRRVAPVLALLVGLTSGVVYAGANYPEALTPIVVLPIYTAAAVLPQRHARRLLAGIVILGWLASTLGPGPTDPTILALIVSAWLIGNYVASRRAYTAELEEKNRLLEQAQRDLAERAAAEERLRIARELHDVVAHTMGVVALHAGTGRMVAAQDPAAARQALATIETAARAALVEMRGLLGVLRGSSGPAPGGRTPAPGLSDVDALVADVRASGVVVELSVQGDRPEVPAGVDLSAYRIVQEALTNVMKHAEGARATVVIRYADDAVTIEVADDGPTGSSPGYPASPPGHGIVGMRERVALYRGEFEAGFRSGGGFRVVARLPFWESR